MNATLDTRQLSVAPDRDIDLARLGRTVRIGNAVVPGNGRTLSFKQLMDALDLSLKLLVRRKIDHLGTHA
jgi:hypothetical protein